jgi:hypothetical protein
VSTLPAVFSPVLGVAADRGEKRHLTIACELAECVIVLLIIFWLPPLQILLPLVFLTATIAMIAGPATESLVPALVIDGDLLVANSLLGGLRQVSDITGPNRGEIRGLVSHPCRPLYWLTAAS